MAHPRAVDNSRPNPDPTILTTAALQREVAALEKLHDQRINAVEQAIRVAHENLVRVPTDVDKAIGHLREVTQEKFEVVNERFSGIAAQFIERDMRVAQNAKTSDDVLRTALQAAKELVGVQSAAFAASIEKSDASTEKRFDALLLAITNGGTAVNDKIDDLKQRLTTIEGQDRGKSNAVVEKQAYSSVTVSWIGMLAGWAIAIVALISLIMTIART